MSEFMEMNPSTREEKLRQHAQWCEDRDRLQLQIESLERELGLEDSSQPDWRVHEFYFTYYATTGFFLGMAGAMASLLFNVLGAVAAGLPPLKLIQVYLTFGLGAKAMEGNVNDSLSLLIGCCLYIGTGMIFGIPFQLIMSQVAHHADLLTRLLWATLLGLALWIINYYCLLSWLQPLLFGGNWIVQEIPWYVGAGTHLVFAWTMAVLYPYGVFAPYRVQQESP
jgi:hypothetical protein